ncbi:trypsin-like serine protease [Basidiobolus meristosporus CBS 931.73]|uniref:Pro-apoptotic serine protease NMA111 n=1 Tax=Basidiobolus meristosporus CBS 931.73 TaxID=1314790 RepID=A0A1Y1YVN0_9FUNG|nr:trypsin-like serine protease [Basidiobolus meristosporus CBS 931.73]|eukprot:ORY02006.1 trypsin-like serine protease [Basidiobolus meristosporus CBS 931.73]
MGNNKNSVNKLFEEKSRIPDPFPPVRKFGGIQRSQTLPVPTKKVEDTSIGFSNDFFALALSSLPSLQQPKWQKTIEDRIKSVVSIKFSLVEFFDTEEPLNSEATGFVVDSKRGLILTNRHVVSPGPFVGEAIFHDLEEVGVFPVYRDPVHDFGFLRFDPAKIKYMPVKEIPLEPSAAKVGLEIRVIGNDNGDQLSILAGCISQLHRNASDYGPGNYSDFNTFYYQAASSASGGSSGSPVIDVEGRAVALQSAGSDEAASNYYLPLDRVIRALKCIQNNEPITRGTIQAKFMYEPFNETRRLGLLPDTEEDVRNTFPDGRGMLVVASVVPNGPAYGMLEEGDILVMVNGNHTIEFSHLEEVIDTSVGSSVRFTVERGGEVLNFDIVVQDLHAITPDRYVTIGGGIFNELSYQIAMSYKIPVGGVYVSGGYGMWFGSGMVIDSAHNKPTPDLSTFIEVMKGIPDGEHFPVKYHYASNQRDMRLKIVRMERHWSPFKVAIKDDTSGYWNFTDLGQPPVPELRRRITADMLPSDNLSSETNLIRSFVKIKYYMPLTLDGFRLVNTEGYGVIVDAARGIIVVSRSLVPVSMGDLTIIIADSVKIPGHIVFFHPGHNFVFISYDTNLVDDGIVRNINISDAPLEDGQEAYFFGFNNSDFPVLTKTTVSYVKNYSFAENNPPRFKSVNFDAITLGSTVPYTCDNGIIVDGQGCVQAFFFNYLESSDEHGNEKEIQLGLPIDVILPALYDIREGKYPTVRMLTIELTSLSFDEAKDIGLSFFWIKLFKETNPTCLDVYQIYRVEAGSPCQGVLKELDIILAVDGQPCTQLADMDIQYYQPEVEMTILRDSEELVITVPTTPCSGEGTTRVVRWCGAVLQEPYKAVLQQVERIPSQVYVSSCNFGSPANNYGLAPTKFITHVNGFETPDLDALLRVLGDSPDNTYVRIRLVSLEGHPEILTLKTNYHYWPTTELVKDRDSVAWSRKEH